MNKKKSLPTHQRLILITLGVLLLGGLFILTTTSTPYSLREFGEPNHFIKNQILKGVLPGLLLIFILSRLPALDKFKKFIPVLFLIGLALLTSCFIPGIGNVAQDSARWVSLGPVSFQPAEFMKLFFILYFAYLLSAYIKDKKSALKTSLVFWMLIIPLGLVFYLQPDMSTGAILVLSGIIMYFASGVSLKTFFLNIFLLGGTGTLLLIQANYRLERLKVFFNSNYEPLGSGYHLRQLKMAVASGRVFGKGLGLGSQKFGFLPHSINDSIFAIIGEELGFIGSISLIAVFVAFTVSCLIAAQKKRNLFQKLVIIGITSWFFIQFAIHVAVNIGAFPLTGVPLPFISYGGSALLAELFAVGILINVIFKPKT